MKLEIKGLQKTSLIDYPPYISSVIFLAGCDFRCPFCQNPGLILNPEKLETIKQDDLLEFLKKRKKWLDAAVISGGEPCLYKDLPEMIKKIKDLGYKVKLDTNGTNPDMIKELITNKLIDCIAMDIKAPLERYNEVANVKVDIEKIKKSIDIIKNSGIDYEFRTTVVPTLHDEDDIEKTGKLLKNTEVFSIQQFKPGNCLGALFNNIEPFDEETLKKFKLILEKYIKRVEIKNL